MCADTPLTPDELVAAGEALYGGGWKRGLAQDLGIGNEGTLAKMAEGRHRIPVGFRGEIASIAASKAAKIAQLQATLTGK